jgi:hypothetical protein
VNGKKRLLPCEAEWSILAKSYSVRPNGVNPNTSRRATSSRPFLFKSCSPRIGVSFGQLLPYVLLSSAATSGNGRRKETQNRHSWEMQSGAMGSKPLNFGSRIFF